MSKPVRRVWNPESYTYSTDIGGKDYIIRPQPLERILEFDDVLTQLSDAFDDIADKFYVSDADGDDIAGPFDKREDAQAHIDDSELKDASVRYEGVSVSELLNRLLSSPYLALKPLIPDLEEEDIRKCPIPQIKHLIQLLVEVNGLEWFESLVKNVVVPLLPQVSGATVGAVSQALKSSIKAPAENGESQ